MVERPTDRSFTCTSKGQVHNINYKLHTITCKYSPLAKPCSILTDLAVCDVLRKLRTKNSLTDPISHWGGNSCST